MNNYQNKQLQKQSAGRIISGDKISFRAVEAYKIARTNLMFTLAGESGCKKIVLTSSLAGEGKTTSCINLAVTFAQTNAKVLIIDADLRRPRVHLYMEERGEEGLADLLAGFVEISDVIRYSEKLGVDYISAGHIPPNPAELLATPRMSKMLDELSEVYDYIFLDSPPVTVVADAMVISKYVSGTLIVVKQNVTPHEMLKKTLASLNFAEAKILGFLINEAEEKQYSYRRGYGYRKKYGYGYDKDYGYGEYDTYDGYAEYGKKKSKSKEDAEGTGAKEKKKKRSEKTD